MATEASNKERQTRSDEHLKKLEETCALLNLKNKEEEIKCKQLQKKIKNMELQFENDKTAKALEIAKQELNDLQKVIENMTTTQAATMLKMNELKKENAELRYQIKDMEERILHAEEAASRARLELHKDKKV